MATDNERAARLSDAQIERFTHDAQHYHVPAFVNEPAYRLAGSVLVLFHERAALVAENARLQALVDRADSGKRAMYLHVDQAYRNTLAAADAENAAMRPLVEALSDRIGRFVVLNDAAASREAAWVCLFCDGDGLGPYDFDHTADCLVTQARALVATWASQATGQTPAAPAHACDECGWTTPLVKGLKLPYAMPNDDLAWLCPNCLNNHPLFRDIPAATPDAQEGEGA